MVNMVLMVIGLMTVMVLATRAWIGWSLRRLQEAALEEYGRSLGPGFEDEEDWEWYL